MVDFFLKVNPKLKLNKKKTFSQQLERERERNLKKIHPDIIKQKFFFSIFIYFYIYLLKTSASYNCITLIKGLLYAGSNRARLGQVNQI